MPGSFIGCTILSDVTVSLVWFWIDSMLFIRFVCPFCARRCRRAYCCIIGDGSWSQCLQTLCSWKKYVFPVQCGDVNQRRGFFAVLSKSLDVCVMYCWDHFLPDMCRSLLKETNLSFYWTDTAFLKYITDCTIVHSNSYRQWHWYCCPGFSAKGIIKDSFLVSHAWNKCLIACGYFLKWGPGWMGMVHVCFYEGCGTSLKARKKDHTITDGWQLALVLKFAGSGFISVLQPKVTLYRFERRCIIEINFTSDIEKRKIWLFINVQHKNVIGDNFSYSLCV